MVLPVVAAALVMLWNWSARRARITLRSAFNTPLLERLLGSVNMSKRRVKLGLVAVGIIAVILALARPQWGRSQIELERTGVDLVIALDVSRSMLAVDAGSTNRLAAATDAIIRLLDELGGDRIGLVVFAGEAFVAAPLTRDHVAVERALNAADPGIVSEQGSNLEEAIEWANESFDRAAPGPRALLVVSDGEQLQGDAIKAARKALREGIRVHTAGVGSAAGARVPPRPAQSAGYVRNTLGREVMSRIDEHRLQRIAEAGGGVYTRINDLDSRALADWFTRAAAALPRSTEKREVNEPRERFQWPLAVGLMMLAMEWVLVDRRRRPAHVSKTTP
jgi:Ca-activated chloride channel family protein